MSYSYFSDSSYSGQRHPGRPNYNPPHQNFNNPYQTAGYYRTGNQPPTTGRGRGGRRGGGRGGGRGYNELDRPFREPFRRARDQYDNNNDLSEKLNELEIVDDEKKNNGINFDAYEDIPVETSGSDVPKPVDSFADVDLGEALNDNIRNRCRYVRPTPIQRHAIPVALAGRDLMACAQTGSGKTAAFCFPIISGVLKSMKSPAAVASPAAGYGRREVTTAYPLALILSPTRELCCQIHEEAKKFCYQTGVKVAVAYGGAPIGFQLRSFERGVDILVATPGRLTDVIERSKVSLKRVKYLALDEADRMLDMGFEPQIRKIVECLDMPLPGRRQTMLFSATFPDQIQRLASDFLSNYVFLSVGRVGSSTDLIAQKVVFVDDMEKQDYLRNLLHDQRAKGNLGKNSLTLVFVETKRGADSLERWLCQIGFPATAIHGDKVQFERERALKLFKNGVTPILVATDVASRGLDIPRVAHVINFDLPKDIDSYVHRIGRTGRAGKSGLATAFFNGKNSSIAKALSELMKEAHQESPNWLTQYVDGSSSGGRRFGSGKFGGRDYRSGGNGNSYATEDNSYLGGYAGPDYGGADGEVSYDPPAADYGGGVEYAPPSPAEFSGGYGGDGHGYESIVAGGWE
ncbi:hypothetical protein OSB04_031539 [Centaurea solstitialis]|uniref:RNA helicase n=1 Tax=Centaurea solstitialis TaxID=347529 RepID=A0AA38W875_9ASTR|nr:hypothetical protein OSB04_031539 [Centaurea solstitialis]